MTSMKDAHSLDLSEAESRETWLFGASQNRRENAARYMNLFWKYIGSFEYEQI